MFSLFLVHIALNSTAVIQSSVLLHSTTVMQSPVCFNSFCFLSVSPLCLARCLHTHLYTHLFVYQQLLYLSLQVPEYILTYSSSLPPELILTAVSSCLLILMALSLRVFLMRSSVETVACHSRSRNDCHLSLLMQFTSACVRAAATVSLRCPIGERASFCHLRSGKPLTVLDVGRRWDRM